MAATCINTVFKKAPRERVLFGDKTKQVESATHVIEVPGAAVEVSRTSDENYWVHLIVNRHFGDGDSDGFTAALGDIDFLGVGWQGGKRQELDDLDPITQVAVLVKPFGNTPGRKPEDALPPPQVLAEKKTIAFPGGLVQLAKTKQGKWWLHLMVDESGGEVVGSRIDRDGGGVASILDSEAVRQVGMIVRSV